MDLLLRIIYSTLVHKVKNLETRSDINYDTYKKMSKTKPSTYLNNGNGMFAK